MALNIVLEVTEVNTCLRALGKQPFDEVANLIKKIKDQGEAQLGITPAAPTQPQEPEKEVTEG